MNAEARGLQHQVLEKLKARQNATTTIHVVDKKILLVSILTATLNHQQTPEALSDFLDSPAATRGDFSLQSHEQIKHRIYERRRKLTNFSHSHRRPSRTMFSIPLLHPQAPSGHEVFTPGILSRLSGSEKVRVQIKKLKEKKLSKYF